jgi:hypothetical protein
MNLAISSGSVANTRDLELTRTQAESMHSVESPAPSQGTSSSALDQPSVDSAPTVDPAETQAMDLRTRIGEMLQADAEGLVNEEELFAAVVDARLEIRLGPEASAAFREALTEALSNLARPDGYAPVEEAVIHALRSLVQSGVIDAETAQRVYSEAFVAAQLDENSDTLFDGRGSANDNTVATAPIDRALDAALAALEAIDRGELEVPERDFDGARPTGGAGAGAGAGAAVGGPGNAADVGEVGLDGDGGFLWKPRSESDGKLVVLLPEELTGLVDSVVLRGPQGNILDEGRDSGVANEGREHFRFDRAGGSYPPGTVVEIHLTDGSTREVRIGNTSARND